MIKYIKILGIVTFGVAFIGFLFYQISIRHQNQILSKYSYNYNTKRIGLGLKEIPKSFKCTSYTWDSWNALNGENVLDGKFEKFQKIFSFKNINIGMSFKNEANRESIFLKHKFIYVNSNILFWENNIESEIEIYERNLDSVSTENITITYYYKDDNGNRDYFQAEYKLQSDNDFFICRTPRVMEIEKQRLTGEPYFGNITKNQADSILKIWGNQ